jgi:3-dehydroquinate synthetase
MQASATIAQQMNLLSSEGAARQRQLLQRLHLPSQADIEPSALTPALKLDKKTRQGRIHWVLLRAIGEAVVTDDVPPSAVECALAEVCRTGAPAAGQARP